MPVKRKLIGLALMVSAIFIACAQELVVDSLKGESYSLKSTYRDGKTTGKYIYNESYKIAESQSFYFCKKYSYDDYGRLVKQEIAVDPDMISSSTPHIRSELMTSQNSTFTGNYYFEYDKDGKLASQKNYFKKGDQFVYTSMDSLEYDGDKIIKRNLYDDKNNLTKFITFEYDNNGNVIKEKHYSYLFITGVTPKLISESSFKFDNKNNPYKIFKCLGRPGLYSNTNNTIETNSILYEDTPGIPKYSTSKTTFEYNDKGFPTREIAESYTVGYKYE